MSVYCAPHKIKTKFSLLRRKSISLSANELSIPGNNFYFFDDFFLLYFRYYRANPVRHTTSTCDGVCALNHYCAITRVDYREYKECFQTAASALASSASRPKCFLCVFNCNLSSFLMRFTTTTTNTIKSYITTTTTTSTTITKEMLMFYFLIITALFVMQLQKEQQQEYGRKQIVRDSYSCIIMYLNVITKKCFNCVSVVSAMLLLLPTTSDSKMEEQRTLVSSGMTESRNNAGISIISTTTTTESSR